MKELRVDTFPIRDVKENEYGFITVEVALTRTGVMPYKRKEGGVQRELKHPDEIFSTETKESAKGIPVTDGHPLPLVTSDNWKQYTKGTTHLQIKKEGDHLVGYETIFDEDLSAYILSGKKDQVSIGFEADIVEESGEFEGEQYDAIQKNIQINHLAHTEQGRAGDTVRARVGDSMSEDETPYRVAVMDSKSNTQTRQDFIPQNPSNYGKSQSEWNEPTSDLPALADMSEKELRDATKLYAFVRTNDLEEITNKSEDLKLPHHELNGNVNLNGVYSALRMLTQTDIPDVDKDDVFNHLATHLRSDFDREPKTPKSELLGDEDDTNKKEEYDMKEITIDGQEFEVAEEVADAVEVLQENQVNDENLTAVEIGDEEFAVAEDLASKIDTLKGKLDGKQDTVSNLQDTVEGLKEDIVEVKNDSDMVSKEALTVADEARKIVGDDAIDINEDSVRDMHEKVIKSVNDSIDLEDRSDEYVKARYDGCLDDLQRLHGDSRQPKNNLRNFNKDKSQVTDEVKEKKNSRLNMRE